MAARPSDWPAPNTINPETKGPMIQGIFVAFTSFAVIIVGLRFWTRINITRSVGKDDWLIFAATINLLASTVTNCLVVKYYSLGMHVWDIVDNYGALGIKMDYSNQLLYHPILALTKVSILLLYHRLSVSRTFRLWINVLIGLNIALTVSIFVSDLLQCIPMAFLWDKTIPGGKCMNQQAFFIGSAVMNIFSDCAVLVLPIPMVWGMQTNTRKKVALIFLFSLGIFVCAVSVIRLRAVLNLTDTSIKDPTFSAGFMWSGIECSVAIVCASVPSLTPFFALHFPRFLGSTLAGSRGKLYNSSRRSEGYTLDSVVKDGHLDPGAAESRSNVNLNVQTAAARSDNGSEESIIPGAVKAEV